MPAALVSSRRTKPGCAASAEVRRGPAIEAHSEQDRGQEGHGNDGAPDGGAGAGHV